MLGDEFMDNEKLSLKEVKENTFKSNLRIERDYTIEKLDYKLKTNKIQISDLSDTELDEMIELYKNKIKAKKSILKQYRDILFSKRNNI